MDAQAYGNSGYGQPGMRWVAPPTWPSPPSGWSPPVGWQPDPGWPAPPSDWQWWEPLDHSGPAPADTSSVAPRSSDQRSWPRRHKVLTAVGALLALSLLGNVLPDSDVPREAASAQTKMAETDEDEADRVTADAAAVEKAAADKAAADQTMAEKAAADKAAAERAAADKAAADQAAAAKAAADKAAAEQAAAEQAARDAEAARTPVLDAAAVSACDVFGANVADVATKQDRSDLARAVNQYARGSSEIKIVEAGEFLTSQVDSWTGFMWSGAVSNFASVCLDGGYGS